MTKLNIERDERLRGGLFALDASEIALVSLALDMLATEKRITQGRIKSCAADLSREFLEVFDYEK